MRKQDPDISLGKCGRLGRGAIGSREYSVASDASANQFADASLQLPACLSRQFHFCLVELP